MARIKRATVALSALILLGTNASEARAQVAFGIGGTQFDDAAAIATDSSDNVYLWGRFRQTVDFDPGPGVSQLTALGFANFVASYDSAGAFRFAFALPTGASISTGGIAADASGNIFVAAFFAGTIDFDPGIGVQMLTSANGKIFVASYDSNGAYRFAFNIGVNNPSTGELATAIAVDASGNSYVTGEFTGLTDFDPTGGTFEIQANGVSDVFVASYTTNGTLRFAVGAGGTGRDRGLGITIDASGNSYVTGAFRDSVDFDPGAGVSTLVSNGNEDVFLASYTDAGGLRYALSAGGSLTDIGNAVAVDAAGNAFITGIFNDQADFDPGPGTTTLTSAGLEDLFLGSYSDTGAFRFAFGMGNTNPDMGLGAATDGSGNVAITGSIRGSVDFDPGPAAQVLSPGVGATDAIVASYTSTGAYRNAYHFQSSNGAAAAGTGIVLDALGIASIVGTYSGTVDFDPGTGVANSMSNGSGDVFYSSFTTPVPAVPAIGPVGLAVIASLLGVAGHRKLRS